jgi:hypothetical protein
VLKDELFDCVPASVSPVAATVDGPDIFVGAALFDPLDSNDELVELI